jgi:hypothetical protein
MSLRRILFWMPLVVGVVAGVIVLMVSVPGVALTYQRQLEEVALSDYLRPRRGR